MRELTAEDSLLISGGFLASEGSTDSGLGGLAGRAARIFAGFGALGTAVDIYTWTRNTIDHVRDNPIGPVRPGPDPLDRVIDWPYP